MSSSDDRQLVRQCLAGHAEAWTTLVDRYGRLVYSIPRRYGMADADADDVLQNVFTALFRKLEDLQDHDKLSSWLITTTHRECWRHGRRSSRSQGMGDLDAQVVDVHAPAPAQAQKWEEQHLVHEALRELGGPCEALLRALFIEPAEPDYRAIAERLGMKVGSIGPTRARCFRKLEPILQRLGLEPATGEVERQ